MSEHPSSSLISGQGIKTEPGRRCVTSGNQPDALPSAIPEGFDTGSNSDFYEYYKRQSLSPQTMQRFGAIAEVVLRVVLLPDGLVATYIDYARFWVDLFYS